MGADLFEGRLVRFLGGVHALLEMIEVRNEPREVEASRGVDCTEPPVGPPRGSLYPWWRFSWLDQIIMWSVNRKLFPELVFDQGAAM